MSVGISANGVRGPNLAGTDYGASLGATATADAASIGGTDSGSNGVHFRVVE